MSDAPLPFLAHVVYEMFSAYTNNPGVVIEMRTHFEHVFEHMATIVPQAAATPAAARFCVAVSQKPLENLNQNHYVDSYIHCKDDLGINIYFIKLIRCGIPPETLTIALKHRGTREPLRAAVFALDAPAIDAIVARGGYRVIAGAGPIDAPCVHKKKRAPPEIPAGALSVFDTISPVDPDIGAAH